jgi:hypothetical protein
VLATVDRWGRNRSPFTKYVSPADLQASAPEAAEKDPRPLTKSHSLADPRPKAPYRPEKEPSEGRVDRWADFEAEEESEVGSPSTFGEFRERVDIEADFAAEGDLELELPSTFGEILAFPDDSSARAFVARA